MSGQLSALRKVALHLSELNHPWALIGALAVSVYVEPRFTKDIDIALIIKTPEEEEDFIKGFIKKGYSERHVLLHAMPVQRLGNRLTAPGHASSPVIIDFLSSSSGIENEIISAAQLIEVFPDLALPVASIPHLIAMKIVSENDDDRAKDQLDLRNLIRIASKEELIAAERSLELIQQRGFSREKDLLGTFKKYVGL